MIDLNLVKSQNMYIIMIVFCCLTDFLYILTTIQWILVNTLEVIQGITTHFEALTVYFKMFWNFEQNKA